jgi:hypothetical protein
MTVYIPPFAKDREGWGTRFVFGWGERTRKTPDPFRGDNKKSAGAGGRFTSHPSPKTAKDGAPERFRPEEKRQEGGMGGRRWQRSGFLRSLLTMGQ